MLNSVAFLVVLTQNAINAVVGSLVVAAEIGTSATKEARDARHTRHVVLVADAILKGDSIVTTLSKNRKNGMPESKHW